MADELAHAIDLPLHLRLRHGVRKGQNWMQLVRFGAVGASGYVVNLAVFAVCLHGVGIDYRIASVAAFLVSVASNFVLNRRWTFDARGERVSHQGGRFLAVSLVAFGFTEVVLVSLVDGPGLPKLGAQAIAIAAATPLSFIGQKLWSFRA